MGTWRLLSTCGVLIDHGLECACHIGHLDMVQWLWQINGENWSQRARTSAWCEACAFGHVHVVQWLWDRVDKRASCDHGFSLACTNGHLHLAQWLWQVSPGGPVSLDEDLLATVCSSGHLSAAKWLWEAVLDPATMDACPAFFKACSNGHLAVAQWLWGAVPSLSTDVIVQSCCKASDNGHLPVVKWLAVVTGGWYMVPKTACAANVDVCRWLVHCGVVLARDDAMRKWTYARATWVQAVIYASLCTCDGRAPRNSWGTHCVHCNHVRRPEDVDSVKTIVPHQQTQARHQG